MCKNLKECVYVSLMEAKPKRKGINYYQETKKNIEKAFILFNSRSVDTLKTKLKNPKETALKAEKYEKEWEKLVKIISNIRRVT